MHQSLILVVDDDLTIMHLVQTRLHAAGYAVISAGCRAEAVTLLEDERPDLIVLDLLTPGSDAVALLHRLRATRRVPVIVLSDGADDWLTGVPGESAGCLTPPFTLDDLAARVAAILPRTAGTALVGDRITWRTPEIAIGLDRSGQEMQG